MSEMLNVLRRPYCFCPGSVWPENLLQKVTVSCLKRAGSVRKCSLNQKYTRVNDKRRKEKNTRKGGREIEKGRRGKEKKTEGGK